MSAYVFLLQTFPLRHDILSTSK
uniref:Uncharacterized protein n=1 Tax=Arundo donax TaxID=35708 RepID=A0A0A9BB71_ARUDO